MKNKNNKEEDYIEEDYIEEDYIEVEEDTVNLKEFIKWIFKF